MLYLTVRNWLRSLDCEVSDASGHSVPYPQKKDQKNRSIDGRTVIPIVFTAKFPPGPATLHIHGPYVGDPAAKANLDITYRFYHQPQ